MEYTDRDGKIGVPYEHPDGPSYQKRIKLEFLKTSTLQELIDDFNKFSK